MTLAEKYRPASLDEVVGQNRAVALLRRLTGKHGGRAYWITGLSGTGKTTLASIIAAQVADDWFIQTMTGEELSVAKLTKLKDEWQYCASGKGGRVYIVNEAHGLSQPVVRLLKGVLEEGNIPRHVTWIFTTTPREQQALFKVGEEDCQPVIDRCTEVILEEANRPFAEYCKVIAEAENLDGRSLASYIQLAVDCKGSLRAMLKKIESGAMLA